MPARSKIKVFSGTANLNLALRVCETLNTKLGKAEVKRTVNGECDLELVDSVRNSDVYIIQSGHAGEELSVNDSIMELCVFIMACKMACANTVTAVLPYFPYSKQSKKKGKRRAIPAKLVASMLKAAGCNQVVVLDLHAPQIIGFFEIPVVNLFTEPFMIKFVDQSHIKKEDLMIMAKNAGAAKRCTSLAHKLHVGFALCFDTFTETADTDAVVGKKKDKDNKELKIIGCVKGKTIIMLDDMIDNVKSFINAARCAKKHGAHKVIVLATHGVFGGDAIEMVERSEIDEVFVTNSIDQRVHKAKSTKLQIMDASPLLSESLRRIHHGESLSFLANNVPLYSTMAS